MDQFPNFKLFIDKYLPWLAVIGFVVTVGANGNVWLYFMAVLIVFYGSADCIRGGRNYWLTIQILEPRQNFGHHDCPFSAWIMVESLRLVLGGHIQTVFVKNISANRN